VKIFNTSQLTKPQLRQTICQSAKKLGVSKVIFNSSAKRVCGSYNAESGIMFLDARLTKKELLDTFFHELGHHVAVKQNKWSGYHYDLNPNITKEEIFKIENKIDQIGKQLWNKYVDIKQWGRYKYAYPIKHKRTLMKTFINN
jgi:hypothetical protein